MDLQLPPNTISEVHMPPSASSSAANDAVAFAVGSERSALLQPELAADSGNNGPASAAVFRIVGGGQYVLRCSLQL